MARTLQLTLSAQPKRAAVRQDGLEAVRQEVTERLVAAAYARGLAEGTQAALDGGVRLVELAMNQLEQARNRAEQNLPREVIELSVEIADQLLRSRLADDAYDIERIVRSALAGGGNERGLCVVHLHPSDLAQLEGVKFREDTSFVPHSGLARGTVHVETKRGLLVRDPIEALEQIREALLEGLV
ncbi:MAG: FliH/SctL family protein [Planctomycetota bacterium]